MGVFHFPTIHDYGRTDAIAPVAGFNCCGGNDPRPLRSSFSASTYAVCSNLAQEDLKMKAIRTSLVCRREMRDGKFGKERSGNKGSRPRTRSEVNTL